MCGQGLGESQGTVQCSGQPRGGVLPTRALERRRALNNGCRLWVQEDGKVLEMDGGDGCTAVWMHLMPLNWTLKSDLSCKLYVVYILPQFKKKGQGTEIWADRLVETPQQFLVGRWPELWPSVVGCSWFMATLQEINTPSSLCSTLWCL